MPPDAVRLLVDYINRTLRGTNTSALLLSAFTTLWLGSAGSISKAVNRAYGVREPSFLEGAGSLASYGLGGTFLIAALTLVVFKTQVYAR